MRSELQLYAHDENQGHVWQEYIFIFCFKQVVDFVCFYKLV